MPPISVMNSSSPATSMRSAAGSEPVTPPFRACTAIARSPPVSSATSSHNATRKPWVWLASGWLWNWRPVQRGRTAGAAAALTGRASRGLACGAFRGVGDHEVADAVDVALELVARLARADAGGRAVEDEVTRLERDELREVGDRLLDPPDLLVEVALLLHLAVHLEPDRA